MATGLFVGLATLDLIYLADHPPGSNEKIVASEYLVAAGGPATNAAIAFRGVGGGQSLLCSAVGSHPLTHLLRTDLESCGVTVVDLAPQKTDPPPVSSIVVTAATGDRAIVSINATKSSIDPSQIPQETMEQWVQDAKVILIDGHQMQLGITIAQQAQKVAIPIVIDAGSWKPGFEALLPLATIVICSANFVPPGVKKDPSAVLAYLQDVGVDYCAVTQGSDRILFCAEKLKGAIGVPQIPVRDTLGAGDIFHGAFCYFVLEESFTEALTKAAQVASFSCQFFGTREWLKTFKTLS